MRYALDIFDPAINRNLVGMLLRSRNTTDKYNTYFLVGVWKMPSLVLLRELILQAGSCS